MIDWFPQFSKPNIKGSTIDGELKKNSYLSYQKPLILTSNGILNTFWNITFASSFLLCENTLTFRFWPTK